MKRTKFKKEENENTKFRIIKTSKHKKRKEGSRRAQKENHSIEWDFIIGTFIDDDFCKWAIEYFPIDFLEVKEARLLAHWIYKYYKKFGKAPKKNIKWNHNKQLKQVFETAEGGSLKLILKGFRKDHENTDINIKYLKDRIENHLIEKKLKVKVEEVNGLIEEGKLKEASEIMFIEMPAVNELPQYFKTIDQMEIELVKQPNLLMSPWLREGETTILYSEAGVGKSLLAILLGFILGVENKDDKKCKIGDWQVKNQTGTLYVDGELGKAEMMDRINKFKWLGEQKKDMQMKVFSIPDYQVQSVKDFNLSKRESQREIISWLKNNPQYKFLVLDSVSTVFNLENENDNSEWNKKINPLLRDLRALGVSHIILHHAGKDGKMRGASSMNAMAHNVLRLKNDPNKEPGQSWFKVDNIGKQRAAGKIFRPFTIKFHPLDDRTEFEITKNRVRNDTNNRSDKILNEILKGTRSTDIAKMFNCSEGNISQHKRNAKTKGFLNKKGNPTQRGYDMINE